MPLAASPGVFFALQLPSAVTPLIFCEAKPYRGATGEAVGLSALAYNGCYLTLFLVRLK